MLKRSWIKRGTKKLKAKKRLRKQSLMPLPKMQRECDKLYQLVGKRLMPYSIVSGKPVGVIHHFFTKQSSSRLRYDMQNGVPLTRGEHFMHHIKYDPTINATIIEKRGQLWYQTLNTIRRDSVKVDRLYYQKVLENLDSLLKEK
jgi:hypothetical protein